MNIGIRSLRATTLRATILLAGLFVAGCGGGGGGGSVATPPPAAPTGIAETYYPVTVGAKWAYEVTSSDLPTPYVDEMVITGTRLVSGVTAWVFRESNPLGDGIAVESYYTKDARAFTYWGENSTANWVSAALSPMDVMRFDGTFSASPLFDRTGIDIGEDFDNDGTNERLDARVTGVVEGYETLVTNAGSFSNTARIRYNITGAVTLSTGGTVPITQTVREWRAPEVGGIRQVIETTVAGMMSTDTLDLKGLSVNGVMAGVFPPRELLAGLASADSDATRPGRPALASDGQRYLLVSNRATVAGRQWVGQFIAADGQLQDSIEISPPTDLWGSPALAWNGANYLLVTGGADAFGMRTQRISPTGVVLDPYPGNDFAPDGINRAIAAGDGKWLAVYRRTSVPGSLFGTLISASGVAGAGFVIATGVADFAQPAVAFDGTNFLVAWESGVGSAAPAATDVYARRVSPLGVLLDAVPFAVSTAPEAQWWPQVACDASNCLIAWVDRRAYPGQPYNVDPGPGDMYGAFVTRDGIVLNGDPATGGMAIATGISANAGYPGLAFNGAEYVLAWSRGAFLNNPGGPTGIYAARISASGAVTPGAPGIAVSGVPEAATRLWYPTLASLSSGTLAVWLNNIEVFGETKSIAGTVIWPVVSR